MFRNDKKEKDMMIKTGFLFSKILDKLYFFLRLACSHISPPVRIITVVTIFILFAILNLYVTFRGIYSIFDEASKENFLEIKHIEHLEFLRNDSIVNQLRIEN